MKRFKQKINSGRINSYPRILYLYFLFLFFASYIPMLIPERINTVDIMIFLITNTILVFPLVFTSIATPEIIRTIEINVNNLICRLTIISVLLINFLISILYNFLAAFVSGLIYLLLTSLQINANF